MNYLDQTFVQRRHELFQVYVELDAFLLTAYSATKKSPPTPQILPFIDSKHNPTLRGAVVRRDGYMCRLTGLMDDSLKPGSPELAYGRALPYHAAFFQDQGVYMYASLEVVHAIPWNPGKDFRSIIQRMIGFVLPPADTAGNMVLLCAQFHKDFGGFRCFFDKDWNLCQRTGCIISSNGIIIPRCQYQPMYLVKDLNLNRDVMDDGATRYLLSFGSHFTSYLEMSTSHPGGPKTSRCRWQGPGRRGYLSDDNFCCFT
ncbi:hypothetical protein B0H13DRAFT_1037079 [Mycena leptocephala]|nr:hypothetical protein B0H13DRAFT_1037079 [Mycena leptocephala]